MEETSGKNKNNWNYKSLATKSGDICYGTYSLDETKTKKIIVFLHGLGESFAKYKDLTKDLRLPSGCALLAMDLRGHGKSFGRRLHVSSYLDYAEDLKTVITEVVRNRPYLVIAHSTGALVATYSLFKGLIKPQKILLSSPFLGVLNPSKFLPNIVIYKFLQLIVYFNFSNLRIRSSFKGLTFLKNPYTSSKKRFISLMKKSQYDFIGPTFMWIYASLRAINFVKNKKNMKNISTPIDVFLPKKDLVVDSQATFLWVQKLKKHANISMLAVHFFDSKHEIFYEEKIIYNRAIDIVSKWML